MLQNDEVKDSSATTTEAAPPAFTPPDGGTKAWLAVTGAFICQFCSFGFINALGTFQYEYQDIILTSHSTSSISWILTFQLFLMFFLSQPVGLLVDVYGPKAILIPASVLEIVGLLTLSFCKEYWQVFLAHGVCFGVGAAGVFMPGFIIAGQYFHRKRALAIGIVASGSSLGGVIFPIFLTQLFQKTGFPTTLRYAALFIGIMLLVATGLVTPPMKPKGWANGKRRIAGLAVFRSQTFLLYVLGAFLFFWGLFAPFDYLPLFALSGHTTSSISPYIVSIVNAGSIPGRIIPSYLSDRLGHLAVMTVMAYASAALTLAIWLPINYHPSVAGIVIYALVFGCASGAFVSLMTPCLIDLCHGDTANLGLMLGSFMSIIAFASLTGLPIQGAILDGMHGKFVGIIAFAGVSMMLGALVLNVTWLCWKREVVVRRRSSVTLGLRS
ncbi:MAG: hypothetical protein M1812_001213 [Candelaria pacifica]|nr:MAG: hypothetical protein M1812_001213 [Candelaria pacifica]